MAKLYLIPTPIGNLEDITLRALRILKEVSLILAEDTRISGFLLKHFEISTPCISHHQHNEKHIAAQICSRIQNGEDVAVVTDAGTPAISDPGFYLVRLCIENDIEVECLPGTTAFVPALVNSGLPCERFLFEGFLPHKKGRQTRLKALALQERTMVLYESPHRLIKTLEQLAEYLGDNRRACVSRELTKIYEENRRETLRNLITHYEAHPPKGEIVIIVEGSQKEVFTYAYPRPAFTVDIAFIANSQILLIERKNPPFEGQWALPGGFIDEDETCERAATRELKEETGLKGIVLNPFKTYSDPARDPRHRTITQVFYACIQCEELPKVEGADDALTAKWFPCDQLPKLAFDHEKILKDLANDRGILMKFV